MDSQFLIFLISLFLINISIYFLYHKIIYYKYNFTKEELTNQNKL